MASEIETKLAELQQAEANVKAKQAELDKATLDVEEKGKQKAALDAELQRVQADIAAAKESRRKEDESFQTKLQKENLQTAASKVFNDVGIKPEDQAKFLEGFKPEAVSVDGIATELRKKYASEHADDLIQRKVITDRLAAGSEDFARQMSSAGFSGAGFAEHNDGQGLDEDDIAAAKFSGMSVERYRELRNKGKLNY
jgi:hypothetical protein